MQHSEKVINLRLPTTPERSRFPSFRTPGPWHGKFCHCHKEVTHLRMDTLGTLCTMQASEFDRSLGELRAECRNVTRSIRQALRGRWSGRS